MTSEDREHRLRQRAYALWEQQGRPEGRHLDHWSQAEQDEGPQEEAGQDGAAEPKGSQTAADPIEGAAPSTTDVDAAAGPDHGLTDFGGDDAEADGARAASIGGTPAPKRKRATRAAK
jgi:hypothetical protein